MVRVFGVCWFGLGWLGVWCQWRLLVWNWVVGVMVSLVSAGLEFGDRGYGVSGVRAGAMVSMVSAGLDMGGPAMVSMVSDGLDLGGRGYGVYGV